MRLVKILELGILRDNDRRLSGSSIAFFSLEYPHKLYKKHIQLTNDADVKLIVSVLLFPLLIFIFPPIRE